MPLFEFRCETCQHDFEELIRSNEQPVCPKCGHTKVEKLFSVPAPLASQTLPTVGSCPPPTAHSCGPGCCRHH